MAFVPEPPIVSACAAETTEAFDDVGVRTVGADHPDPANQPVIVITGYQTSISIKHRRTAEAKIAQLHERGVGRVEILHTFDVVQSYQA